jgi:phospholipid/cholesterol/gamma-HCH transport system substrate-binding protein
MARFGRFFRKSFLERNQLLIGTLGILFIIGGSAIALLLTGGVLTPSYRVQAEFADAAGLKPGDDVTVAGLEAGSVDAIEIENGKVLVTLKINDGVELTSDTRAEIVVETLLGKKSVNLISGDADRALSDGDVIPESRTTTPVEVTDLNDISVKLLSESDAEAFNQLLEEVTSITEDKSSELAQLIDGLDRVAAVLADKKAELSGVIDALDTLSRTFAERDDRIVSLIDRYNRVLGNLAERQDELRVLLTSTDSASHEIADLVRRNRSVLDRALDDLHVALQVVDDHQVDLAATITYLEASVRGYASVGYSQGIPNRWANIFVQSLGPLGVDALVGPCGLLDNALDELLGPDPRSCEERARASEPGGDGGAATPGDGRGPLDDVLPEDLPGTIEDLIGSVTGLTGIGRGLL